MSWSELESKEPTKAEENMKAQLVRRAAIRAFGTPEQAELKEELEKIVRRGSYAVGRSPEEVAFLEGYRKLALDLLKLGGVYE